MTHSEIFNYIKKNRNWNVAQSVDKKLSVEWQYLIKGDELYILFQETNGYQDWIQNFSFTKRKYGDLQFHHGFYELFDLMRDILIKVVSDNIELKIIVAGWSQGAALATLAAQDIYYHLDKKVHLVTFGAPMVVYGKKTRDACRLACLSICEYCNRNDVVTYVPPFPGWYHLNRVDVGDKFNVFKLMNPMKWHTNYGDYADGMAE